MLQFTSKGLCLIFYKSQFGDLLDRRGHSFWQNSDAKSVDNYTRKMRLAKRIINVIISCYIVTVCGIVLNTVLSKGVKLPLYCWIPHGNLYIHYSVIIIETLVLCLGIPGITGFDMLFACFCMDITNQFQLLERTIKTFDDDILVEKNYDRLRKQMSKCVEHHAFLIEYVQIFYVWSLSEGVLQNFFTQRSGVVGVNISNLFDEAIYKFILRHLITAQKHKY